LIWLYITFYTIRPRYVEVDTKKIII